MSSIKDIKLTQYSHGAGCGCKISPKVLDTILQSSLKPAEDSRLLVGNASRDDAAVYDLGNGQAAISTTDFFMPIADDPFDFGRIAATNAISDIYAMGGEPLMAIAILGWPIDKLPPEVAQQVVEGGRQACMDAGIMLAGGHSIDNQEPLFGLAVTGRVEISKLKQNNTATEGCLLYLSKPLGVGILTTAQKKGLLQEEHARLATDYMTRLNVLGSQIADFEGLKAMTDVTGFGLLGHLSEMCEGSKLSAVLDYNQVPIIPEALDYLRQGASPGGTVRNWDSYGHKMGELSDEQRGILCDPQTSGGLLMAVEESAQEAFEQRLKELGLQLSPIGRLGARADKNVVLS